MRLKERSSDENMDFMDFCEWFESIPIQYEAQNVQFEDEETVMGYSDGLFLIELVSKLERRDISGINKKPRTKAASLHNIKRVLEVLSEKPSFPWKFQFCDKEILAGKSETIKELMITIRKLYRHRNLKRTR